MKIYVAWESKNRKGGGWSFGEVLVRGAIAEGHSIVENYQEADVVIIPSASVITKELFRRMKADGKKIVLRVDNILKNSRNKNSGMSRMLEFACGSDLVVYQCEWSFNLLNHYLKTYDNSVIIYNGIDLDLFNPSGNKLQLEGKTNYVFSMASRGENKGWHIAWAEFRDICKTDKTSALYLCGEFDGSMVEYNFDFYNGEICNYVGMLTREQCADLYRSCDYMFATYFEDCFSNAYLEALCSGCELYSSYEDIKRSGGTGEMIDLFNQRGREYFSHIRMVKEYLQIFKNLV